MALRDLSTLLGRGLRHRAARLRRRLASEAGFAVPTVMLMTVAALGMAGVAVTASIGSQSGTVRDQESKTALAVAESGVEEALLRYNRHGLVDDAAPCAPVGGVAPDVEGWCPEVATTVNGSPLTYQVRPAWTEMASGEIAWTQIEVVSTGTLNGVTRRVDVTADSSAGQDIFIDATVQSKEGIELRSKSQIHAGTATNGDLTIDSNAKQCGTATVGIGKEKKGGGEYSTDIECGVESGEPAQDEISLPAVNQGKAPTENDNDRLFTQDYISGNKNTACFDGRNGAGKDDKSCGPRELIVGTNSSVTIGGKVYSFCKLTLKSNSSLYVAPGADVKIYFDSPEACGYSDEPVIQLELLSNSRISPVTGESGSVALYFVGSTDIATKVVLNSETSIEDPVLCSQNFVIYGPRTDIELQSNTSFCGALAGKTILLNQNSEIWTSSGVQEFFLPLTAPHYEPSRFVDCAATSPTGSPSAGC